MLSLTSLTNIFLLLTSWLLGFILIMYHFIFYVFNPLLEFSHLSYFKSHLVGVSLLD